MRISLILILTLSLALSISAEEKTEESKTEETNAAEWSVTPYAQTGLSLYSENWDGGDVSSFMWVAKLDADFKKQLNDFLLTENILKLAFGQTITQSVDTAGNKEWDDPLKSTDNIEFKSDLDFTIKSPLDPYIGVHLTSQFWDNSNDMDLNGNPIEILEAIGVSHKTPKKEAIVLNSRLGFGIKQNINRNRDLIPVVNPTDTTKNLPVTINDVGLQFETHLKAKTKDNRLNYASDFYLFKTIDRSTEKKLSSDAKSPDIKWDNTLKIKIIKVVSLDITAQMLYDREIDEGTRWKENMTLSLSYTFTNKK